MTTAVQPPKPKRGEYVYVPDKDTMPAEWRNTWVLKREFDQFLSKYERDIENVLQFVPHAGFRPHPGQYRDIQRIAEGCLPVELGGKGARKVLLPKGNGWGKTWFLVNLMWNIMAPVGRKNEFFDFKLFNEWPFPKHLRLLCNAKHMKEGSGEIWKSIQRWWPATEYKAAKQGYDYFSFFEVPASKFTLDVMTFDQPTHLHESSTLGAVFCDEPPPYNIYTAYPRSFRHGGFFLIGATLVSESEWIEREFIDDPKTIYSYGDITENCKEESRLVLPNGGVLEGHLTKANVEAMIDGYADEEREARRTGKPLHLRGCVFNVNPSVHFIGRDKVPALEDLTCYLAVDPHPRRPWVVMVDGVDRHGTHYIVDEWPKEPYHKLFRDDRGTADFARIIKQLRDKWRVREMIIDGKAASTPIRNRWDTRTTLMDLEDEGLYFESGDTRVEGDFGGTNKVKELLRHSDSRPPGLYLCDDLYNVKYQMQHVNWDEKQNPEEYGLSRAINQKFFDYPRVLMYLVMHDGGYRPVLAALKGHRTEDDLAIERKVMAQLETQEV